MGLISRVSSRTYRNFLAMAEQQAEPIIGGPGTFPDPAPGPGDPADSRNIPQNPALKFLYDPANANLIAIFGWVSKAAFIYYYVYGVPKLMKESDSRTKSREDRLKKLQGELDKTAADRMAAKKAKEEEERLKKHEIAKAKHEAMQSGGTFQGNSYSLAENEEARKDALEEAKQAAKLAKERRDALQNSNSFRDDNFNPLSGSSEGGPVRFRNTQNCGPRGG